MIRVPAYRTLRHGAAFVFSGSVAFLVDASLTIALVSLAGVDKFLARLMAILVAQGVSWALHRRFTFEVKSRPNLREIVRFSAFAWGANGLNYAVYAVVLLIAPSTPVLVALVAGSVAAMIFAYLGFRFGVFRRGTLTEGT